MNQTLTDFDSHAILNALRERYPVFRQCRPLALGSGRELMAAAPDLGVPKLALRRWLRLWVTSTAYLKALATDGAVRYALDGTPGDPVSPDHQEHALKEVTRRLVLKAKHKPRKAKPEPAPAVIPIPEPAAPPLGNGGGAGAACPNPQAQGGGMNANVNDEFDKPVNGLERLLAEARAGRFKNPPVKPWPPAPAPVQQDESKTEEIPPRQEDLPPKKKAQVARRSNGKREHLMDYIPDKQLYAAVMFAREKMRDGCSPDYANGWAARVYSKPYHVITAHMIAKYTGQCGGTVAGRRKNR